MTMLARIKEFLSEYITFDPNPYQDKLIEFSKYNVAVSFYGNRCIGLGWWKYSDILWRLPSWDRYDGSIWFSWRLGPIFYCRGPYWTKKDRCSCNCSENCEVKVTITKD